MCERDEIWQESRCFAYEKIQELYDDRRGPEPGLGRPAGELPEKAREMILASLALVEKVEAA